MCCAPTASVPDSTAAPVWVVHFDGSALPNPGRMAWGVVMVAPDGVRHTLAHAGSEVGCNNEAELRGLIAALQALRGLGAGALAIHSDSSILVEQLGDGPRRPPPIERLAELFDEARRLLAGFDGVGLRWIPRHRNGEADALARDALGLPPKPSLPPGRRGLSKARRRNG